MAVQTVFKRYEYKYLLTQEQKAAILRAMAEHMALDRYGRTTIRNIYFDTENYRLVRRSIEKPAYKEKLRIRSYAHAAPQSTVFVELKKKYDSVVYKRRLPMPEEEAMAWTCGGTPCAQQTQIAREIDYFLSFYKTLRPQVFLSYEREAFYALDGSDFRVTFDENILGRQQELSLQADAWGEPILEDGMTLMELKCSGGIPLWMAEALSELHLYRTSFSKYGAAYRNIIFPARKEASLYA